MCSYYRTFLLPSSARSDIQKNYSTVGSIQAWQPNNGKGPNASGRSKKLRQFRFEADVSAVKYLLEELVADQEST